MSRKVIHEHKIPKSVTVALYAIAISLTLNLAKPFIGVSPASAELFEEDLFLVHRKLDKIEQSTSITKDYVEMMFERLLLKN